MSLIVWLIAYFAMIYGVMVPAFGDNHGFLGWFAIVVISWVVANIAQGIAEAFLD